MIAYPVRQKETWSMPGRSNRSQQSPRRSVAAAVLEERVRSLEKLVQVLEGERDDLRRRLNTEAEERRPGHSLSIPADATHGAVSARPDPAVAALGSFAKWSATTFSVFANVR
jgi:hypothetical protein